MEKENYFLKATFNLAEKPVLNVPTKIYLPDRIHQKPYMKLLPTKEQYDILSHSFSGSFFAEVKDLSGLLTETLQAPTVYFENSCATSWDNLSEFSIDVVLQDLSITKYLSSNTTPTSTFLQIWISPNKMIHIPKTLRSYPDGSTTVKSTKTLEFALSDNIKITLDKVYKSKKVNSDNTIKWHNLVLNTNINIPANDLQKIKQEVLSSIDDFLLLVSFISRTRTGYLGFDSIDKQTIYTYYRGYYSFPTGKSEPSINDGILSLSQFESFINHCYSIFINSPYKDSISKAIYALLPYNSNFLEEDYLSLFSALESLILDCRRLDNLEFIFDNKSWNIIKGQLKTFIKAGLTPSLKSSERCLLYKKLNELNRVSLSDAFDYFCQKHNIDLSDLWPVFSPGQNVGLSEIRNKLIHGDNLNIDNILWVATENLKWILERILITLLDWPLEKTEITPRFLMSYAMAKILLTETQEKAKKIFYSEL